MTFSAHDVNSPAGASLQRHRRPRPAPQLSMSYRVGISGGAVTLILRTVRPITWTFTGPRRPAADTYYEVIIVKQTDTVGGQSRPAPIRTPRRSVPPTSPVQCPTVRTSASEQFPPPAHQSSTVTNVGFANRPSPGRRTSSRISTISRHLEAELHRHHLRSRHSRRRHCASSSAGRPCRPRTIRWIGQRRPRGQRHRPRAPTHRPGLRRRRIRESAERARGRGTSATFTFSTPRSTPTASRPRPASSPSQTPLRRIWSRPASSATGSAHPTQTASSTTPTTRPRSPFPQTAQDAYLAPLTGHEFEATSLYVNGYPMPLSLIPTGQPGDTVPSSMVRYSGGFSFLDFNAGIYRLEEISMWQMARQPYQVIDDMFGRLVPVQRAVPPIYLSGIVRSFRRRLCPTRRRPPLLPMNTFIDNISVTNAAIRRSQSSSTASLDLPGLSRGRPLRSVDHAQSLHAAGRGAHGLRYRARPDHLLGHAQQRHRHRSRARSTRRTFTSRTTSSPCTRGRRSATWC